MDNLQALPHDVLLLIASFAEKNSLLSLLATSSNLHKDCAKYLLRDTVFLDGDRDVVSFIYFMRCHSRRRWRHLRSLHLSSEPLSPSIAEELARVIPRASHLYSLKFDNAEKTLGAHHNLAPAFAAIKTIKYVAIECGYQHACRMLEAMHWPLETVILHNADYIGGWHDADRLLRMHPASLLKNSRTTLKTLECDGWRECSDVLDAYPVYPHLKNLHVAGVWCPRAAQWATTYPNLKYLSVHTFDGHFTEIGEEDFAEIDVERELNVEGFSKQIQHWNELEVFTGGITDLYLLGLPCRIRNVRIAMTSLSVQFFHAAMKAARPTRLTMIISDELFHQSVPTYLQDPGIADVQYLDLRINPKDPTLFYPLTEADIGGSIGHLLAALRRISARELALQFNCETDFMRPMGSLSPDEITGSPPSPSQPLPSQPLTASDIWRDEVDINTLTCRCLEEVPSLEKAAVTVKGSHSRKVAAWSKKREPDNKYSLHVTQ